MSIRDDAARRWREGRKRFGEGPWVGREPIEECYEELLDALNYLAEHGRQKPDEKHWAEGLMDRLLDVAVELRSPKG